MCKWLTLNHIPLKVFVALMGYLRHVRQYVSYTYAVSFIGGEKQSFVAIH